MPFTYEIDAERHLTWIRLSGEIDCEQMHEAHEAAVSDLEWKPGFSHLWDWRQVTEVDVRRADVPGIMKVVTSLAQGARASAFLVRSDMDDSIVRLFALTTTSRTVRAFRFEVSALAWLREQEQDERP